MNRLMMVLTLALSSVAFGQQKSPVIVANINLLNQVTPFGPVKVVTPSANAFYRITALMEMTQTNNLPGSWCVDFGYTDARGAETSTLTVYTMHADGAQVDSKVIIAPDKAGVPLTLTVVACPNGIQDDNVPFDLFATVEQLQ